MQTSQQKPWYLYRLDYRDGVYTPHLIGTFDLDAGIAEQNKLQGNGIQTQLSSVPLENPHRIFDIGLPKNSNDNQPKTQIEVMAEVFDTIFAAFERRPVRTNPASYKKGEL